MVRIPVSWCGLRGKATLLRPSGGVLAGLYWKMKWATADTCLHSKRLTMTIGRTKTVQCCLNHLPIPPRIPQHRRYGALLSVFNSREAGFHNSNPYKMLGLLRDGLLSRFRELIDPLHRRLVQATAQRHRDMRFRTKLAVCFNRYPRLDCLLMIGSPMSQVLPLPHASAGQSRYLPFDSSKPPSGIL